MITEFPLAALFQPPYTEFQTQHFEVAFSTMYADVKEPAVPSNAACCGLVSRVSPCRQSQKVHFAFIPVLGGRGRIRTCDPALIKRML